MRCRPTPKTIYDYSRFVFDLLSIKIHRIRMTRNFHFLDQLLIKKTINFPEKLFFLASLLCHFQQQQMQFCSPQWPLVTQIATHHRSAVAMVVKLHFMFWQKPTVFSIVNFEDRNGDNFESVFTCGKIADLVCVRWTVFMCVFAVLFVLGKLFSPTWTSSQ